MWRTPPLGYNSPFTVKWVFSLEGEEDTVDQEKRYSRAVHFWVTHLAPCAGQDLLTNRPEAKSTLESRTIARHNIRSIAFRRGTTSLIITNNCWSQFVRFCKIRCFIFGKKYYFVINQKQGLHRLNNIFRRHREFRTLDKCFIYLRSWAAENM